MNRQALSTLLYVSLWFFMSSTVSYGGPSDIACLKALKQSLKDPFNHLETWNFEDNTKAAFICKFNGVECWQAVEDRVLNIQLSGMGLIGEFPKGLEGCSSLTGLNLSNNELSGLLPPDIDRKIPYVTSLDLSCNHFSGNIPAQLGRSFRSKGSWPIVDADESTSRGCKFLNVLKLDNNRLTGQIPLEIGNLGRLRIFSVTNNLLSGPILDFANLDLSPDSFANNSGLCGKPLEDCKGKVKLVNIRIIIFGLVVYMVVTPLSSLCWYKLLFADKRKSSRKVTAGRRRTSQGAV